MKRRDFLTTTVGLTAVGMLPTAVTGCVFMANDNFISEAYDDNKVVRVFDPKVTDYDFSETSVFWKTIDQDVLHKMLTRSLNEITDEKNEAIAWKMILANSRKADLSDIKVVVKVYFNNTMRDIKTTLNNSPAMIAVLTRSVMEAGIREENVCFFDCSRPFPDEFKNEVRSFGLTKVEMMGKTDGIPVSEKTSFLSDNKGFLRDGKPTDQYPIPQLLIDADYLLNLHLVKMHSPGVTGAMKNLFGLADNVWFYMHHKPTKSFHVSNHIPDISLNTEIRQRVRLNISEFIFGGHTPDTIDRFNNEAFFPDGKPSSLIVSRSPFYHDTVLYSFMKAEYESCDPETLRKDLKKFGSDIWLKNASDQHPKWKFDQARFVEYQKNDFLSRNLSFNHLNLVTI
jgi:hypothetical protein